MLKILRSARWQTLRIPTPSEIADPNNWIEMEAYPASPPNDPARFAKAFLQFVSQPQIRKRAVAFHWCMQERGAIIASMMVMSKRQKATVRRLFFQWASSLPQDLLSEPPKENRVKDRSSDDNALYRILASSVILVAWRSGVPIDNERRMFCFAHFLGNQLGLIYQGDEQDLWSRFGRPAADQSGLGYWKQGLP